MKLGELSGGDVFILYLNQNIRRADRITQQFKLVEFDGNAGKCLMHGGPDDGASVRLSTNLEVRRQ